MHTLQTNQRTINHFVNKSFPAIFSIKPNLDNVVDNSSNVLPPPDLGILHGFQLDEDGVDPGADATDGVFQFVHSLLQVSELHTCSVDAIITLTTTIIGMVAIFIFLWVACIHFADFVWQDQLEENV